jgi:hypothetical protein
MTGQQTPDGNGLRLYPPPPKDFDPFTATQEDLKRHGLPLRPDRHSEPGMAALWERQADRYRSFEHLEPLPDTATAAAKKALPAPALGLEPTESCGYQLFSSAPFTALFMTWTVPDLRFSPDTFGFNLNLFRTFVGLGFLDVHVEMTVDPAQNVNAHIWAQSVGQINLPVGPGDVISGSLCLDTKPPGRANYFLTNETTAQTVAFAVDTHFPPATSINAGVSRGFFDEPPFPSPLARFGVVYFDEISAFSTSGSRSLTSGQAITMVGIGQNHITLARPDRLNDFAFKTIFAAAGP